MDRIATGCYEETYRGHRLQVYHVGRDEDCGAFGPHWNIAIDGQTVDAAGTKRNAQAFGREMIDNQAEGLS